MSRSINTGMSARCQLVSRFGFGFGMYYYGIKLIVNIHCIKCTVLSVHVHNDGGAGDT